MCQILCAFRGQNCSTLRSEGKRLASNGKEFANAFESYLRDLDCPMRILKSKDVNVKLQWLTIHATSLAFEERKTDVPVKMKPKIEEIVELIS